MRLSRPPRLIDWFFPSFTWRLAVSEKVVFLTFDDGPHPDITPFVLDELQKHDMKATFFCVGENLIRFPGLKKRILAEGHRIGNHTMRHTKGTQVPDETYLQSVNDFENTYPTNIFRPPYGRMRKSQHKIVSKTHSIIMWSFLTYDYDKTVPVEQIKRKFRKTRPGDIIVLHDNPKITERMQELLPDVLQELQQLGFRSEVIPIEVNRREAHREEHLY